MKRILSVILSAALLICCVPLSLAQTAAPGELLLASISDIHYYPASLALYKSEEFYTYLKGSNAVFEDMDGILDSTFAALEKDAEEKGLKYVVVSGDMTTNGEYAGHAALAQKLLDFEEKTGLTVFVINGNHDINNSLASEFTTPDLLKNSAKPTTPAEFYELYKDLGYSDADATFAEDIEEAAKAGTPGALSYSVSVAGGYRFIMIDAGKYPAANTKSGEDEHETGGRITDDLLKWILAQAAEAQENGETPIVFSHWNLSEMNYMHGEVLQGFVIDDGYKLQEIFADAGIHFAFSGHQHVSDIDVTCSDSGEPLYSCIVPTLTQYPFCFRETYFTRDDAQTVSAEYKQYSCDTVKKVKSLSGEEYAQPYYMTTGAAKQIGDTLDPSVYLLNMIKNLLSGYVTDIQEKGSILAFVKDQFGFDLKEFIAEYIPESITLGGDEIFSINNIMNFANDLDEQLYANFIEDPDELLWPSIKTALDNILAVQISDVPCTKFIDTYGFGSTEHGGTIGDLFLTVLVNMYPGNETCEDDEFIKDVLEKCQTTQFVDLIFDTVIKYVADGLALDVILGNTEIHLDTVLPGNDPSVTQFLRALYSGITSIISSDILKSTSLSDFMNKLSKLSKLLGTTESASYKTLIEMVLGTGFISYGDSVDDILYMLLDKYLGDTEKQAAAYQLHVIADGIFNDPDKDWDVTYTYSGPEEVVPSVEDMQLPANVTMAPGKNAEESFIIKWMTKYSVTGSDIEIVKANEKFTGKATTKGITAETEYTTVSGYGFDFGSFGILPWTREVNIHTVTVTGLKPGTEYKFRIGDFEKDFVSEGSIKTADNDNSFTFAFLSDNAGVSPAMYENFNAAVKAAAEKTDLNFIIHGGGSVVKADNEDQWGWSLNGARDVFLNVPVLYTSGTGDTGENSPVLKHYSFSELPPYANTDYGAFYSYDYENVHFTVLNTNDLDVDGTLTAGQLKWLNDDLGGTPATWKILVLHTPFYGVNQINSELKAQLAAAINDHHVNLVLGGTDTVYSRTHVMKNGTPKPNNDIIIQEINGKKYEAYANVNGYIALSGCSTGSDFDTTLPDGNYYKTVKAAKLPVFTVINVDGDALAVDAYQLNPDGTTTLIDSFALTVQYVKIKMGDIDIDDEVTAADARLALRAAVGLENFTNEEKLRADVDGDMAITAADARLILRAAVDLEKIKPEYVSYRASDIQNVGF